MSRASGNDHSIANLLSRQAQLREKTQEGLQEADRFRAQEKRLEALSSRKDALLEAQNTLNTEIETLKAQLSHVQSIDQAIEDTKAKLDDAIKSKNVLLGDSPQKSR